jgi:hypothetical protein
MGVRDVGEAAAAAVRCEVEAAYMTLVRTETDMAAAAALGQTWAAGRD